MVGAASQEADTIRRKESAMSRRSYSREFKLSAVKLVNHQGYTVTGGGGESGGESAEDLRVTGSKRSAPRWARHALKDESLSRLREELRQPRQENKRLLMEREILKTAAAFFAKNQS